MGPRDVGADAAIAAGLAQQGSLATESALRVFALAAAMGATGRLTITPEGRSYALSFRRGAVEHAASTDPEHDLGAFLVTRGKLAEGDRQRAEAAKAPGGGDLAAALISQRLVAPAEMAALMQEHGAAIVQRALAAEAGGWSWKPDAPPPPSAFPLGPPFALLCAAVRTFDATTLMRRLGDREHRPASRVGGRIRIEDLKLTPQEARAAALFDGARTPAELAASSPGDSLVLLRTAVLLGETDLLSFSAPRKAPEASAPAPATPPPAPAEGPAAPGAKAAGAPANAAPTRTTPAPAPPAARTPSPRPPAATPRPAPKTPSPRPAARTPAPHPAAAPSAHAAPQKPAPAAASPLDRAALEAFLARLKSADHFQVLGVKRDAAGPQIKVAYFQLAKLYHPDAVPADAASEVKKLCADVFSKLSAAWGVLGDDGARANYLDELVHGGAADVDAMAILRAESVFQEGEQLVKARRYGEARAKFEEAIKLNADEPEFTIWRAFCDFCLAESRKAALASSTNAIEIALKRNPRCAQGYLFLGQMAKVAGDLALAERQLKRGLAVAPEHAELQRELKYLRR